MKTINLTNKKIDEQKLSSYGFIKTNNEYHYEKSILNNEFKIVININEEKLTSKIIEVSFNDEYLMADVDNAVGEFVGKIKQEYEDTINDIFTNCFNIFESEQSLKIIDYVKNKYKDDVEYLWPKFPKNAVARNKKNNKWYLAILTVKDNRVGGDSEKEIEVIDLMYQKDIIDSIVDHKEIYPGYHMNKKSWITIRLDGTVSLDKIYTFIDNSYELSISK